MNAPTYRVRAESNSAPHSPKTGMVGVSVHRDALSARRALSTLAAVLALSTPIHLGAAEATSDAASLLGTANRPLTDEAAPRAIVRERASRSGWRGAQWRCIDALVYRESRWNPTADNSRSSAYGLFQFLHMKPGTSVVRQYAQFERYLRSRYHGDPCAALHANAGRWY